LSNSILFHKPYKQGSFMLESHAWDPNIPTILI
jgi:hypothetical protein